MIEVTPLILTFNEKENIARSLACLHWAKQVLVIDSFSTDGTPQLAATAHPGVTVVERQFDSFAGQCNFGIAQIRTPWVLSIDADYLLTPKLIDEIRSLQPTPDISGYEAAFHYCVYGRPLRSTLYPNRIVLYRKDHAHYSDEGHGHRVKIAGGHVAELEGKINHDDRKPLSRWIRSQDRYMIIEARHLLSTPLKELSAQDRLRRAMFFAPAVMLLYLLFARGLILDGWPGWFYVCQRTIAELLLSIRILVERERLEPTEPEKPIATDRT